MRWYILKVLVHKEILRHLANRGGIALILLLVVAALLLSFFGKTSGGPTGFTPAVKWCFVDYAEDTPFIQHLRQNVPEEMEQHLRFRPLNRVPTDAKGVLQYAGNTAAIQIRPSRSDGTTALVWFWYPGNDQGIMAPFEIWFYKEALRYQHSVNAGMKSAGETHLPFEIKHFGLKGGLDPRSGMATALVLFALFFICVYLLPSLTCEEHEKGVLLAQALSPASTLELLGAKFLFYPVLGVGLAAFLAATYDAHVLLRSFFWLTLLVNVFGSMGIGLVIASLARTQRAASMGAMCYLMAVSLLLVICQQNQIRGLPLLSLEYYGPRLCHAALTDSVRWYHWFELGGAAILSGCWIFAAGLLFRRRGWQ